MNIGESIKIVDRCGSTNDLARSAAAAGAREGTVIISREQTKGRGTRGRAWYSARDKGLYASVILRPKKSQLTLIPLLAGLAVKEAIAEVSGVQVGLRWPNDIVLKGKKLGGILCEGGFVGSRPSYVILGIGLNLRHRRGDFPAEIASTATSLEDAGGKPINEALLQQALWKALDRWYSLFNQGEEESITRSFEASSVFSRGEKVTLITDRGEVAGAYKGVGPQGAIIVEKGGAEESFFAAEVKETKPHKRRKECS